LIQCEGEEFGVEGGNGCVQGLAEGGVEEEGFDGGGLKFEGAGDLGKRLAGEESGDDFGVVLHGLRA